MASSVGASAESIRPRYGAVGQPASIAIVERFIRSMKQECTRCILVPSSLAGNATRGRFVRDLVQHRAATHGSCREDASGDLQGSERQDRRRFETRPKWPHRPRQPQCGWRRVAARGELRRGPETSAHHRVAPRCLTDNPTGCPCSRERTRASSVPSCGSQQSRSASPPDPVVNSHLLYQLSYSGTEACQVACRRKLTTHPGERQPMRYPPVADRRPRGRRPETPGSPAPRWRNRCFFRGQLGRGAAPIRIPRGRTAGRSRSRSRRAGFLEMIRPSTTPSKVARVSCRARRRARNETAPCAFRARRTSLQILQQLAVPPCVVRPGPP